MYRQWWNNGLLGLFLLVVLSGCSRQSDELLGKDTIRATGLLLNFTTIEHGHIRRVVPFRIPDGPSIFVLTSAEEINQNIRQVLSDDPQEVSEKQRLTSELQQVDFNQSFAVLVAYGPTMARDVKVTIKELRRQDNRVNVYTEMVEPEFKSSQVENYDHVNPYNPYHLITVPREGTWGQLVEFQLVANGRDISTRSHVIP